MRAGIQLSFSITLLILPLVIISCNESSVLPTPLTDISITLYDGSFTANLMPIVPPDPVSCRLTLIVRNRNTNDSFYGISIPEGTVFLDSNKAVLGRIGFTTDWDGQLSPGGVDTVHLVKTRSSQQSIAAACGARIGITLTLRNPAFASLSATVDSLPFFCVY